MLSSLNFGVYHKLPVILQGEQAECGLASLAMICNYWGLSVDLISLRQQFPSSLKGMTLSKLIAIAQELNLISRPLRLELDELNKLKLPCILHWEFNHFLVLKKVKKNKIIVHDPAHGERKIALHDVTNSFTGVAIEFYKGQNFQPKKIEKTISLTNLIKNIHGFGSFLIKIAAVSFLIELIILTFPFYLQWVIDNVLLSKNINLLKIIATCFLLLALLQFALTAIRNLFLMYMNVNINIQLSGNVFSHLINLPISFFESRHVGDIVSRFHALNEIQKTVTTSFMTVIIDGLMAFLVLVMMTIYSIKLSMISVIALSFYILIKFLVYPSLRESTENYIFTNAKQESHFLETLRGIKTIKLFEHQSGRRLVWFSKLIDQTNAGIRVERIGIVLNVMNGLIFATENVLVIYWGAMSILEGGFTIGALMAFLSYKITFTTRVSNLVDCYFRIKVLKVQIMRLSDIVLSTPENCSGERSFYSEENESPLYLSLKNIDYRYSSEEKYVLRNLNLDILPNISTAIIGKSGCGKTTLMNILLGIISPESGQIMINGRVVNRDRIISLRKNIGVVTQNDTLFAGTIIDNICLFDSERDIEYAKYCAALVSLSEDIEKMPMDYNTLVGDMGTALSGGQVQRLLLARAIYRKPRILLLDEATSHLDIKTEEMVNSAIQGLHMTRVIIAHRLETIYSCDRVIGIENGSITLDIMKNNMRERDFKNKITQFGFDEMVKNQAGY
ncbi:peptidase domain-containing ABC transporter [Escherichia coli]|nr:peptidase domain-containing ABC transporter [Escherichia coli]